MHHSQNLLSIFANFFSTANRTVEGGVIRTPPPFPAPGWNIYCKITEWRRLSGVVGAAPVVKTHQAFVVSWLGLRGRLVAALPTSLFDPCIFSRGQNESNYTIISALVLIIISGLAPNFWKEKIAAGLKRGQTRAARMAMAVHGRSGPIFASINPVRASMVCLCM